MLKTLARYWWVIVVRGVVAIIFGLLIFVWPALTIDVLILLFGAYALVDGIGSIITGIRHRHSNDRWWLLLEGIAGLAFSVLTFVWSDITGTLLLTFIAAWAIITGIFQFIAAFQLRRELHGEWVLAVAGLLSVTFGTLMVLRPSSGALTVVWIIGAYSLLFGVLLIYLGFQLRPEHAKRR